MTGETPGRDLIRTATASGICSYEPRFALKRDRRNAARDDCWLVGWAEWDERHVTCTETGAAGTPPSPHITACGTAHTGHRPTHCTQVVSNYGPAYGWFAYDLNYFYICIMLKSKVICWMVTMWYFLDSYYVVFAG